MVQKSAASMDRFISSSSTGTRKAFSVGQKFLAGLRKTVVPGILFMALLLNVQKGWGQTTVIYTQQTGNYYSNWKTGTADAFNQGANQVGMYANGGGTKQVVNWRKFRTDASGVSTSDRALQVGDRFVVTLSATRAFGRIGFALLASPGTGSWANRESNYAISFNLDGPAYAGAGVWGNWYARFNGGATSAGSANVAGQQNTYKNFTFTLTLTAPDRMNATWTDGTTTSTLNDILLNTSNPITDYSIFLEDDWDGGASRNIFWGLGAVGNQHTVTNQGALNHGQSNGSYTIGGVMFNGLNANSASLNGLNNTFNKSGTGNVTLNAANTYVGQTQIDNGELWIGSTGSIAAGSGIFVGNGGQPTNVTKLWLSNATGGTTFSNNFTINNGNATTREVGGLNTSGTHTFSGNITNNSTTGGLLLSTVNAGGSVTFSGVLSGAGAYTTQGAGTITFSGASANTYTGATTVNAGTLVLNKTASVIALPTNTTIAAGATIRTGAANQWGTGTPPLVTINGNGILNLNNNNQRIALASASATASVTLGSATLDINNTGTDTYAGVISGSGGVTKSNTGTQVLSGVNTYTGTTTISGGTLRLGASGVIADASNVTLNGGTFSTGAAGFSETVGTLNLNANSTIAFGTGAHTLTFANSSAVTWAGGFLFVTGWTGTFNGTAGAAGRLFIANSASGINMDQQVKILFLNGTNYHTATILGSGEVVPTANVAMFWNGNTVASWTGANAWSLNPTGPYNQTWTSGRAAYFNLSTNNITGAATNVSEIVAFQNVTVTASGTLGFGPAGGGVAPIYVGSGRTMNFQNQALSSAAGTGIAKNGQGILLSANGNNPSLPGGITINQGIIGWAGVNGFGTGALTINGGVLSADGSARIPNISSIVVNADFQFGDAVNYAAGSGSLTFGATVNLGASSTRTITIGRASTYNLNGIISGAGSNLIVNALAAGTLSLGAANTYGGNTTINGGTLACGIANTLPSTTTVTLANTSGASLSLGANSQSIAGLAGGGTTGGNVSLGTATLTLTGAATNTFSGAFSATAGNLVLNNASAVLTLANAANGHTGTTTVTAGELRLNPASDATFASQIVLNGGTLSTSGITAGRTWTSSSTLNLNVNSTIALASGVVHTLTFANSSLVTWAGTTLTITGWNGTGGSSGTGGKIIVGAGGLLPSQLSKISFSGYPVTSIILAGELVPPAPAITYTWTGSFGNGLWTSPSNWSPGTSVAGPTSIDHVIIANTASTLNISGTVACTNFTVNAGAIFAMAASSALTVSGNYTYNGNAPTFNCTSTLNISSSSSQTIPAHNYGNLNLTGGPRVLASTGTIGICGTYTPGSSTTITGSTVNFNGTGAQTINAIAYNNLTISNSRGATVATLPAGTISVAGVFDVSTYASTANPSNAVNAASIFDFTSGSVQAIPAFFYGQLNNTGNGNRTWASSGIIDINQGFSPGSGTHTITGSTIRYSNTSAATWNLSTFNTNLTAPARQYNNLIFAGSASTIWSQNGITLGIANNLTVTSGTLQVGSSGGAGVLNVDGNIAIDGANGTLNLSSSTGGNTGTINLLGNFSQSNGLFNKSGSATGTFNFARTVSSPVQTISQSAGTITNNGTTWNLGTGSTPNVVEFTSNVTMGGGTVNANNQATVDFKTFILSSTGTFAANTGTTLVTANTNATGAIMTSGANGSVQASTRTFTNAGVNYTFNGTVAQFSGNAISASANIGTLNLSNTSGANPALTFTSSPTIATALNVNNGINQLGSNNITITPTTAASVTGGSSTAFIQTNGAGRLIRAIATAGLPINYNFPIGTGTNYTPAAFNFTANAGAMNLIVGTVGSRNTNDVTPTDYINNRYWVTNLSGTPSTYTYNSVFTYITSPTDVVGTIGNIRLNRFGGITWTQDASSSASGSSLSSSSLNESTGSLAATAEWAGRVNPPFATYTWDGSTNGDWDIPANWDLNAVPSATSDVIIIPNAASYGTALAITGTRAVADFTVQANGTFSMGSGSQLTISGNYSNSSSTAATFDCASTLILSSSSAQTLPAANYGNLNLAGGARTLTSGATTRICGNYTAGTSTTVGTSTVEFNGTAAQAINTNAASFATVNITNTAGTVTANTDFTASNALTINSSAVLDQASGTMTLTGSTVTVNGTLRNSTSNNIVGGTITVSGTGTYDHNRNSGVVPAATWQTGSICLISGTTSAVPTGGLGQAFSDFTWNTPGMSAGNNLSGALTNVGRDLRIISTGTTPQNLGLVASTAYTATVGRDLLISGGNLILVTGANSNNVSLGVTRNVELSNAASFIVSSGSGTGTAALNVTGTFTNGSSNASSFVVNSGTKTVSVSATVTGAYTHSGSGTASVNTNSTATTVSLAANGGYTISAGIQNVANGGAGTLSVADNTTLSVNGGTLNVAISGSGLMNAGTGTTATTTTAITLGGGSLVLANGGTGTINAYADLNMTSGSISRSSGTATINFLKPGVDAVNRGTSTITQTSGTLSGTIAINVGNGGLIYPRLLLGSPTVNIGANTTLTVTANGMIDCGASNVLAGNAYVQNAQGTLVTANPAGITTGASGSIQTTTRNFGTLGYFIYNGTTAQVTGDAFPAQSAIFTIFNPTGVTLTNPHTIFAGGQLILFLSPLGGILDLANNNLTIQTGATVVGASATRYVRTSGTGRLIKSVSTSPVLFEVGNSTYNPITLTPGAGTNIPYQVRVIDGITSPTAFNGTKLINRYWSIAAPTAPSNTLTMNGQWSTGNQNANYNAGTQVKVAYHNGTIWNEVNSTQAGANPFTSSGGFSITNTILNAGITFGIGKDDGFIGTYVWNGSSSSLWTDQNNWTPTSLAGGPIASDNVRIDVPGSTVLNINSTVACNNFELIGTGTFNMGSSGVFTINGSVTYSSSSTPGLNCASTINIANSGNQPVPPFNYGNLNATGGDRVLSNTGTIGICGTFTRGAGAYTVTGSTVNYNGSGAQTISVGTYNNLTISNNRGSATLTLASGTIDIAGAFTPTVSNYISSYSGNTINFSGASGQVIPAFNYFNITSANNNRTWANSGVIDINNTFTPGTGTHTVTGSTVRYSSTSATAYTLISFTSSASPRHYNNLEVVGGVATTWELATGFNMGCAGNFNHTGTGVFTVCNNTGGNTMTVNGNMVISGGGSVRVTNSTGAGTLTIAGNTSISSGNVTCVGASAGTGGNAAFNTTDFTINPAGQLILEGATTAGTAAATVTINGNCNINSSTANAINLGAATGSATNANNIINLKGNFSKSGTGTIGMSGTFAATARLEFNLGSVTQTFSHAGAAMTAANFTVASGSTLQLSSNMVLGSNASASTLTVAGTLDAGSFTVSPGNVANNGFALQTGATLITNSATGVSGTISGFTNANTAWTSGSPTGGAIFVFRGNNVNTGFSGYANILNASSTNSYNINWEGTGTITLDKTMFMHNVSYTSSGRFYLNANNLTISSNGTLSGSPFSLSKMFVVTSGSLIRSVQNTGAGLPFTWPIGEETGTAEYSPVSVNSIAGAGVNGSIGFNVVDGIQPNNSPAISYITRYWPTTVTGFNVGYTLSNLTFTYDAADIVVGPESSLRGNSYSTTIGDWTQYASSSAAANVLTITSGISGSNMPTNGTYDITARIDVPVYYRTVNSGTWQTLANWEVSSDPAFTTPPPSAAVQVPNNVNSEGITIRNHAITTASTITVDNMTIESGGSMSTTANSFTVANGTGTDVTVNSGGSLLFSSATDNGLVVNTGATILVNGTMRQSGGGSPDVTNNGTITIGASGTYDHARNAGIIPTCTWNTGTPGATCVLTGTGVTLASGLGQSFANFFLNRPAVTSTLSALGALTTVNQDLTVALASTGTLRLLSTAANHTLTVGGNVDLQSGRIQWVDGGTNTFTSTIQINGNLTQAASTFIGVGSGSQNISVTVGGNFLQNGGTFSFNGSGASVHSLVLRGNLTQNGVIERLGGTTTASFINLSNDIQDWDQTSGTNSGAISWVVGNGTTSNQLRLLTDVNLGTSTQNFTVSTNAIMNFRGFALSGTNTTFTTGASPTLMIGSPDGIVTAPTASGNIRTLVRTVNATTTYIYTGAANQNSGNLLPSTLTGAGRLTISNTGAASNNTVTLTNTLPMTTPQLNLTSGLLAIGTGQTMVISSGGTVNGTGGDFASGAAGGMVRFSTPAGGAFNGNLNPFNVETNGNPCGVNFGSQTVTIQSGGTFNINAGGFVNFNPPAYASGSTLTYLTGADYGRGLEWSTTSGKGYPHHVNVSTTTLNPASTGAVNAAVPFQCAGNLTIATGGNIYLDFGGNNMTEDLRVLGNLNLQGNLSGSQAVGSDIFIGGNWTNNGSGTNFFANGREVVFNGSTAQTIGGSNGTVPAFAFLAITTGGSDVTSNLPLTINNRLQLNSGKLIIGNNNLTIAATGLIDQGGVNSFIVTNGTGLVTQTMDGGNDWYPVGPATNAFAPVTLNQSGTSETIGVRVINVAGLSAPSYGNAVNDTTQMLKLEWVMNESVPGANSIRTTFGWQGAGTAGAANIEGSGFDRTTAVYHGNWTGSRYAVRASNAVSGTNPYFSLSTFAQPYTGTMSANQRFVLGNINGIMPCFQTAAAGDWNTSSNWADNLIPPAEATVCINHAMTLSSAPPNPSVVTIGVSGNLSIASGVSLTLEPGGTFTNNRAGFNMTSGTLVFQGGTSTINGSQAAGLYNLEINGNTTLTTVPTINNQMEIKAGGFIISGNGPVYGSSSTLIYNTGGNYNRSNEWRSASGAGYPAHVLVTGNTSLNLNAGTAINRSIQGNMQIDNGSSVSQGTSSFDLIVPGNFTLNGSYTQSSTFDGDLILGGNWTSGSAATLTSNNRDVSFNGNSGTQTISNAASGLQFGFLTIDNTGAGVNLLNNITASTFRVNPGRTFSMSSSKIIIAANGEMLINGTFNANNGTIEFTNGGRFRNNGTFNPGTSTLDFLPGAASAGEVLGTVQTNFHNIYLGSNSGIDFNSGAIRGRISGVFQLRSGSYVSNNAPIYESGSKLMYSGGGTFNRNVEWDPATLQKVEVRNNTTLKCGSNGTGFSHVMADSLIIQSGSTFDMTGPDMTAPTVVGGSVLLRGTLNLSNAAGGDIRVGGDWENNGGTFNCNGRLTTFDGAATARLKGPSTTTFCFLTVNKSSGVSFTADAPVSVSRPPAGTELRISGGTFDLNGQSLNLGAGSNTLRINEGDAAGQTLRTGGTSINGFNNYTDGTNAASLGGIVDFSGTSGETYPTNVLSFHQLWNSGSGNKVLPQSIVVKDDMKTEASATIDFGASAFNIEVRADLFHQGTTSGSGTGALILNGTTTQNMSGNGTYRNLEVNKATGNVNSSGRPTINGKLNMLSGKILQASASDSITLGASATITETTGVDEAYVKGKLSTTRVVGTAAENFGGMGISLTAGANLGTVTATRQSGVVLTGDPSCCAGFTTIARNWHIVPTVQPSAANRNLSLSWPSEDDNLMNINSLQLWKRSSMVAVWQPIGDLQDVSATNPRVATWTGVSSFSQFTGADLDNPLPLGLMSFNGTNEKGNAVLRWQVSESERFTGYKVQKSEDGNSFRDLTFVTQDNEKSGTASHAFTDMNLITNSYYKIGLVNKSGKTEWSQVVYIKASEINNADLVLIPNPSSSGTRLSMGGRFTGSDELQLSIFGTDGRNLGESRGKLDIINRDLPEMVKNLPKGIYQIRVISEPEAKTLRFMKD